MTVMPVSKLDDMPEDFTLDQLKAGLTPQEFEAIQADAEIALPDPTAEPAPATPEANAQPAPAPAPAAPPPPAPVIPDTTEAVAKIAKADADLTAIAERYDAGELTRAEMLEQQKAIIAEQARAQVLIDQAAQVQQQVAQTAQQQWFNSLEAMKKVPGNEVLWAQEHVGGWDAALKAVSGNPAYQNLPFERQQELARDFYAADYKARTGQELPLPAKQTAQTAKAEPGIPDKPRTDPRDPPVQTLSGMNGDGFAAVTDGTFAAIDAMTLRDPLRAEQMLAALTPEQRERFFESA